MDPTARLVEDMINQAATAILEYHGFTLSEKQRPPAQSDDMECKEAVGKAIAVLRIAYACAGKSFGMPDNKRVLDELDRWRETPHTFVWARHGAPETPTEV